MLSCGHASIPYLCLVAAEVDKKKLLKRIRAGAVQNVNFGDMKTLIEGFGFRLDRREGSHHIFLRSGVKEILNLQEVKGQAKPYQIKQFLKIVDKNELELIE
jgi:hypothetical protein